MEFFETKQGKVFNADCLDPYFDKVIPDASIDMILCDLPYGTTACAWDEIIPFIPLWSFYNRIIKPKGAIVLTASQPFTTKLIASNLPMFKYELIWVKNNGTGFIHAKNMPLKKHENICIFSKGVVLHENQTDQRMDYFPQGLIPIAAKKICFEKTRRIDTHLVPRGAGFSVKEFSNYPTSVLFFDIEIGLHPTQKPVPLFQNLITTFTLEGATVLDNCAGSGTTGIACINSNRNFLLIEKDADYYSGILKRIQTHKVEGSLF